jgi:hypothetical protein
VWICWVCCAIRVSFDLQQNKRADQLIADRQSALNAPVASSVITFNGQPADNDTVTVAGRAFPSRTAAVANDVKIGATTETALSFDER